jgi:hypothetical protein
MGALRFEPYSTPDWARTEHSYSHEEECGRVAGLWGSRGGWGSEAVIFTRILTGAYNEGHPPFSEGLKGWHRTLTVFCRFFRNIHLPAALLFLPYNTGLRDNEVRR